MRIRSAVAADLTVLPEIERSAGAAFHGVGMPEIAEDDPGSAEELDRYRRAGLAWVAVDEADRPVAYLVAEPVDGNLHIEQVSVHADHARRGIGRALIEHVAGYAAERGFPAVTLTTFTDVAWNAPYYRRLGFAELADAALGPELREIRAREAAHGLDRWPRCAMVRPV